MTAPDLFTRQPVVPDVSSVTVGHPLARNSDPPTSHAAAEAMDDPAEARRLMIVAALRTLGAHGANAHEMDEALGWPAATSSRRMHELADPKFGPPLARLAGVLRPTSGPRYLGAVYQAIERAGLCPCRACAAGRAEQSQRDERARRHAAGAGTATP